MTVKKEENVPLFRDHVISIARCYIYHANKEDPKKPCAGLIKNAYSDLLNSLMHSSDTFTIKAITPTTLTYTITFSDTQQVTLHDGNKEVFAEKMYTTITATAAEDLRPLLELLYWYYCIVDWDHDSVTKLCEFFGTERPHDRSTLLQFVLSSYLRFGGYLERTILERYHFTDSDLRALKQNRGKNTELDIAAANDLWMIDPDGANKTFADVLREHAILPPL